MMQTYNNSWLSTAVFRGALLDELEKIAEETQQQPQKPDWKKEVAKTILIGGAGTAAGYGAGRLLTDAIPSFFKNQGSPASANARGKAVHVILPILGAAAFMLGDRVRKKMDTAYKLAPEWGKEPQK